VGSSDRATGTLTIFVEGLELTAQIGVHAHERNRKQVLLFDIEIELQAPQYDTIDSTLDYDLVVDLVKRILGEGHIQLVETVVQRVAEALGQFRTARRATVRVRKPGALDKAKSAGAVWSGSFGSPQDRTGGT
jgi:7,8-dihydroneopterin aldolase/epimerase/oxygenase